MYHKFVFFLVLNFLWEYGFTEVHRHTKLIVSWNFDINVLFVNITECSVFLSVAKCVQLFLLKWGENSFNFYLNCRVHGVFSLFICLKKFTMNAKSENQSLLENLVKYLYFSFNFINWRICGFRSKSHLKTFLKIFLNVKLSSLTENSWKLLVGKLHKFTYLIIDLNNSLFIREKLSFLTLPLLINILTW